ncbi:MAG: adenosylhomocysteinase [Actinobacteria bacterium]|nr:adenosylhomocysteinase [Actinomycetota bacterium]
MPPDAQPGPPSDIADAGLAEAGRARIGWAQRGMPVLRLITERYAGEQPFAGLTVAACLHVTAETAGLVGALRAGGARMFLAASNPLSTQDDVAAALADAGTFVFARAGVDPVGYAEHIHRVLDPGPDLVIDDGGDLVDTLAGRPELAANVRGGCESTSTGVLRLRRMAAAGALAFPMVAADATTTKRMFDSTAGTGQSVLDGVLRATNILLAGRAVVVAGFGPCGQGIAARAHGLGAQVIVTEVDPVRALDAVLRGYRVLPMREAAAVGEVIITATGSRDVVTAEHLAVLRDGAILANAGHFDAEVDVPALAGAAVKVTRDVRPHADEYTLPDGRRVVLLAEGRVVNLVAAEGNPPQVMDVSFAGQALVLRWLARDHESLAAGVHDVPGAIDEQIARLTLESSGARIDALTPAQREYLSSWRHGP